MVKFILQAVLLSTLLAMVLAQRCPHTVEPPCMSTLPCEENCSDSPTECADVNGIAGELAPGGCNCCNTCVYIVKNNEQCGYNGTTHTSFECRCNFQCVDGVCQPENKPWWP